MRTGERKGLQEAAGASVVGGRTLGAGRWGRALRSGVEPVLGARRWREYRRFREVLGAWAGKARLGWEVLVGEDAVLGGGARDVRVELWT